MNFLYLRNEAHAQSEIRAYAQAIEGVFAEQLPITAKAFREHWGIAMLEGVNVYD
jgi:thymidylate synthase ThyX